MLSENHDKSICKQKKLEIMEIDLFKDNLV